VNLAASSSVAPKSLRPSLPPPPSSSAIDCRPPPSAADLPPPQSHRPQQPSSARALSDRPSSLSSAVHRDSPTFIEHHRPLPVRLPTSARLPDHRPPIDIRSSGPYMHVSSLDSPPMMGERREIPLIWGRRERIDVLWHGVGKLLER
jgi:hypothetical protein